MSCSQDLSFAKLLTPFQFGCEEVGEDGARTPFNKDQDKIIFSGAFRRLARKTQVHPLAKNDHVHNRLTHSLEVSRVGRSLGILVGKQLKDCLPETVSPYDIGDIVQATCLAHDIGNPPFGHTGEEAIRSWFLSDQRDDMLSDLSEHQRSDLRNFEGNAQGLRILCKDSGNGDSRGMRLTYATLASFIKYPWTSVNNRKMTGKNNKFGVFESEIKQFENICRTVSLKKEGTDNCYVRHPLNYLMEAADDFCYGLLDLEDGLEMGLIQWSDFYDIVTPLLSPSLKDKITNIGQSQRPGCKAAMVRGEVIDRCITNASSSFIKHKSDIVAGRESELIELCDSDVSNYVKRAKSLAREEIFSHQTKRELEIGAYSSIDTLLDVLCTSSLEVLECERSDKKPSFKAERVTEILGKSNIERISQGYTHIGDAKYQCIMSVLDFVSGMTDNYAVYLTKQFRGITA